MKIENFLIFMLVLIIFSSSLCAYVNKQICIASADGCEVILKADSDDKLIGKTKKWLKSFLYRQGYSVSDTDTENKKNSPIWILETQDSCPNAKKLGIDTKFLKTAKADAYILQVFEKKNQPIVLIVGRNNIGLRSGVARLIAKMKQQDGNLYIDKCREERSPFFEIRRLNIAATGRICQDNEWCKNMGFPEDFKNWHDTLWTNWSNERIQQYVEQLWLFGFNSLEAFECRGYRGVWTDEDLKNNITPKLRVLYKAAKDNGLQTSLFIWGQSLFVEGENYCWNAPAEKIVMMNEYKRLAQTYGDLVDNIVIHVGDPGGCDRNGCDAYITTQQITNYLLSEFRKVNPNVTATLSTWANFGFWKGAPNSKLLDETYSNKEISIALHRW